VFFLSGVFAAFGYVVWSFFTGSSIPGVGASGALYGIFACLAVLAPRLQVYFYFVPIRITYALILFALFDILLIGSEDMIAHAAHLSGLAVGLGLGFKLKQKSLY
jgi:membrane associated rhomboid family serine protease